MADDTNMTISISLWGEQATGYDFDVHPVIAFKGIRISNYGGKSLNCLEESTIIVNPNIPQAHRIKDWYKNKDESRPLVGITFDCGSGNLENSAVNERLIIEVSSLLHEEFMKNPEKAVYFTVSGYINSIKPDEKCIYNA